MGGGRRRTRRMGRSKIVTDDKEGTQRDVAPEDSNNGSEIKDSADITTDLLESVPSKDEGSKTSATGAAEGLGPRKSGAKLAADGSGARDGGGKRPEIVSLDLTTSDNPKDVAYAPEPKLGSKVGEVRERKRGQIAMSLVGILGLIIAGSLICFAWGTNVDGLKTLLSIILGPIVALVGSVAGFYFGGFSTTSEGDASKR
jgi:hypothetical protein